MKLRLVHITDEGYHKVLILDDNKTKAEGKLVAWVMALNEGEARDEARDVSTAILRNGKSLLWN